MLRLAALALLCATPLAAQDDGFEKDDPGFAPFRAMVATGDLLSDTLPSADASSTGCMVISPPMPPVVVVSPMSPPAITVSWISVTAATEAGTEAPTSRSASEAVIRM
jgi:hypothetical protein